MNKTFLIIGQIWPEPETTGAGLRMMQLISMLKDLGMKLHFVSTAQRTAYSASLEELGVYCKEIKLNHDSFDAFIRDLDPGYVMFDRFAIEEQFSWRVAEQCPGAVRILDSEDLHFLRAGRKSEVDSPGKRPKGALAEDIRNRELASICRSDLTLVISEFEMDLLTDEYGLDKSLLLYMPFVLGENELEVNNQPDFELREGFMFMGNWKHAPNKDAVLHLKRDIWPLIRSQMPGANLYVYGAYGAREEQNISDPKVGFHLMGWAPDKEKAYLQHRICLAPMRYGAGLKGKLIDAMRFGTPNISSSMAAEAIAGNMEWGGIIADDPEKFAAAAVQLYQDRLSWEKSRNLGAELLKERFSMGTFCQTLGNRLMEESSNLVVNRKNNWIGNMLWHHSLQSTKYLSKWIEAKNKLQ